MLLGWLPNPQENEGLLPVDATEVGRSRVRNTSLGHTGLCVGPNGANPPRLDGVVQPRPTTQK